MTICRVGVTLGDAVGVGVCVSVGRAVGLPAGWVGTGVLRSSPSRVLTGVAVLVGSLTVLVGVAVGVDVGDAVGVAVDVGVAGITLTDGEVFMGAETSPLAVLSTTNTAVPDEVCTAAPGPPSAVSPYMTVIVPVIADRSLTWTTI